MGLYPDLYIKNNKNNSLFGIKIKNIDLENLKSKNLIISVLENYNGNKYNLIRKDGIVFNVWDHGILEECKLKESGFSISKKDIDNPDVYLFLSEKITCFYHFFGHKEIDLSEKNIYTQLNELPINKHIV